MDPASRYQKGAFSAWLGIITNILLTIIKGVTGYMAGSAALVADAFHSASDILASTVVLVGLKISRKPPDRDHPYGHGRAESIAAKIVAVIIMMAGLNIAISSLKYAAGGEVRAPSAVALAVAFLSIATKEGLFRYVYGQGKRLSSPALVANAWEHRNDAISSVAVFFGIGGALLGRHFQVPHLYYLDPVAGLLVSFLIIKMGYTIARDAAWELMDSCLGDEEAQSIKERALEVSGVKAVNHVRARVTGHLVCIDLEIGVDEEISVRAGHDVAFKVREKLLQDQKIADVLVHVDPFPKNSS